MISFITCSAKSDKVPILRNSLRNRLYYNIDYELIVTVGADRIATGYNKGVQKANSDTLIFIHEDVECMSAGFDLLEVKNKVAEDTIGVLGVAGSKHLPNNCVWWQGNDLSGACAHTDTENVWMNTYGQYGEVEILDGVLLICSFQVFEKLNGFDETIPGWDFYDIDFTYRASKAGLRNLTYPLFLVHHSQGDVSAKPQWHKNRELIEKRIREGYYTAKTQESSKDPSSLPNK